MPGTTTDNPLLAITGLPVFDRIEPAHVEPAVTAILSEAERWIASLEARLESGQAPTWENTIEELDDIGRPFERGWGPVSHLFSVKNSPALRKAYEAALPRIVDFGLRVKQSEVLYRAVKSLREGRGWDSLSQTRRRIIEQKLLSVELAGIGLEGNERKRFNEIAQELSKLSTDFSNRVLDATRAFSLVVTDPADAEGLPPSLRQLASQSYNEGRGKVRGIPADAPESTPDGGPWRFTLETPSFVPFMEHCRNRELRERMLRAYVTRASHGPHDNSEIIRRILQLRLERAKLLGYAHHADVSLAEKMAPSVAAVEEMFETLRAAAWASAERDMRELTEFAAQAGFTDELLHWDVGFWAERLREERFEFTDEQLRPYFPLERVLQGLFGVAERVFGIRVEPADGEAPVWHPDVRFFKVFDADDEISRRALAPGLGEDDAKHDREPGASAHRLAGSAESGVQLASFYLDPYSRPENKRGGAWMNDCLTRRRSDEGLQLPVAHLVCNSTPPVGKKPSLMTFREVETLFHEFGHGLQHMLTTVDDADAAGISGIEWDAVELPSQFMENWCYHRPTLLGMTAHYETGEPLPDDLFDKIKAARTYRAGTGLLRQLQLGMTDIELHTTYDPHGDETPFDVQRRIWDKTSLLPMLPENRFLCGFTHIFAGGYSAGYYSYKWAEVLAADAFAAFDEAGLHDEAAIAETGRRFRDTVLSAGGGRHPMEVFKDFRGREPDPAALLRQFGLLDGQ
jgi:oligopeptidase A